MDPNTTLHELRELVARVQGGLGRVEPEEFAERFDALDGWMSKGGFVPDAWRETRDHR